MKNKTFSFKSYVNQNETCLDFLQIFLNSNDGTWFSCHGLVQASFDLFGNFFDHELCSSSLILIFLQFAIVSYLKEETEAHPLVVFNVSSFFWIYGFINTRMCHINTDSFPELCMWNESAISVEHIFWYVFSMDTVDGISNVLPCHYDQ